jgi:hypothetical protein
MASPAAAGQQHRQQQQAVWRSSGLYEGDECQLLGGVAASPAGIATALVLLEIAGI